MWAVP